MAPFLQVSDDLTTDEAGATGDETRRGHGSILAECVRRVEQVPRVAKPGSALAERVALLGPCRTVTQGAAPGNLRLFPADVSVPLVSTINWSPGQTRANNAIVAGSADGTVAIKVKNSSAGTVHFVLDVSGYFQ